MLTKERTHYEADRTKIKISNLSKSYIQQGSRLDVLHDINLDVQKGEFLTIVGSSGCGKSTLLRLIAGLDTSYEGTIRIDDQVIDGIGEDRGMVFQDHSLVSVDDSGAKYRFWPGAFI